MKKFDKSLLDKYFNNQCTLKEAKMVLDWLDTPEGQQCYAEMLDERLQNLTTNTGYDFQREAKDEKILRSIYESDERLAQRKRLLNPHISTKTSDNYSKLWWGLAAACIGFLLLAVVYKVYFDPTMVYKTAYGETKTVKLQDGSTVTLNANSQLSFTKSWNSDTPRQVWLEGEAYFSITHQENHQKFLVHTQNLDVEVLGTEFNVHNRRGETKVVLNSGKVKLDLHADTEVATSALTMQPGDLVTFSEKEMRVEKKVVNPEIYTSWVNNVLIFDDVPMSEIAQVIEDNFGIVVSIQDPLINTMHFNAEVPGKDLNVLLTLLEQSFGIVIEKENGKIIISTGNADGNK